MIKIFCLMLLVVLFARCDKEDEATYCNTPREVYQKVTAHNARIFFDNRFGRYALDFEVTTPGNIDTQIFGYPCELQPQFQKEGLQVKASGMLKKFNRDEGFVAQMGGEELYFFEPSEMVLQ